MYNLFCMLYFKIKLIWKKIICTISPFGPGGPIGPRWPGGPGGPCKKYKTDIIKVIINTPAYIKLPNLEFLLR